MAAGDYLAVTARLAGGSASDLKVP